MKDDGALASENEVVQATADGVATCRKALSVKERDPVTEWPLELGTVDSLVEYNANIGCYQCFLFPTDSSRGGYKSTTVWTAEHLSVRVAFPHVQLRYSDHSVDAVVWQTDIERHVDVTLCSVEEKGDHWYLRLPIRLSDRQPLGGFSSFTMVSPLELQLESYGSVCCRTCNALLLDGAKSGKLDKVLPLPSANWMDMFDFWGAGIGAFEHIPRDDIQAQRRRVLVGESYLLLHTGDLTAGAAVADRQGEAAVAPGDDANEEREWVPLTCAACAERIGLCSVEQPETVRLHKHVLVARRLSRRGRAKEDRVELLGDQEEVDVFGKYTIDSIVSAKLLEMADSDGVFRFVLTPSHDTRNYDLSCGTQSDTSDAILQLQLLSWETMIKQQGTKTFRRVLKVLYGRPPPTSTGRRGLLPSHTVSLPRAMCLTIADRLHTSSKVLPSSLRTFNRMHVGYLYN
ncbi:unnamed protein product [Hyaloperonospora brassicae]|uniref:HECT-type E3 ubiquitin transferase E3D n=1 Tax=Hyaloperonospora brassicae TaxID=162125 RepID=A0AAV0TN28_HYABA|nr:unnamed protein product [Hyaloperonospora brassicae]